MAWQKSSSFSILNDRVLHALMCALSQIVAIGGSLCHDKLNMQSGEALTVTTHAVRFRLCPRPSQAAAMRGWIGTGRALWNHLLGLQKATYEAGKRFLGQGARPGAAGLGGRARLRVAHGGTVAGPAADRR